MAAPRQTREEFMFDSQPIQAWRLWDINSIADTLNDNMPGFVRAMALASQKAPDNPWEYMLQPRLTAVARNDSYWEPRDPQKAVCTNDGGHAAPHLDCECGYWSLKTEDEIATALLGTYRGSDAIGRVNLWGRFCEFDKGYRAEYAYPAEIWLLGKSNQAMASQLADAYGIPVHVGEPAFVADVRVRIEKERKKTETVGGLRNFISSNMITNWSPAMSGGSGATYYWTEDALVPRLGYVWPEHIAKPGELWAEIQKHPKP
jgi:hypothetical protein